MSDFEKSGLMALRFSPLRCSQISASRQTGKRVRWKAMKEFTALPRAGCQSLCVKPVPTFFRVHSHSPISTQEYHLKDVVEGFPGGAVVKNLPANAGDTGSSPGPGRSHMPQSN